MEIRQLHEVAEGGSGWFEVNIKPEPREGCITLRLGKLAGMGSASFDNGEQEYHLAKSGSVQVLGRMASDLAGAISLTAWFEDVNEPVAIAFFDVVRTTPEPHIFRGGHDITGTSQPVIVGEQILLNVPLHPGLDIRSQTWTIEPPGEYVGGFVHLPARGGPQPVSLNGPTATIYWVRPGTGKKVTYQVTLDNGEMAKASVLFDVEGPLFHDMEVPPVELMVGPGTESSSSYMSFAGKGISFRAHYNLPEGLLKNYTWVQLVTRDVMEVKEGRDSMVCTPKSLPEAELGEGLDTDYPYDSRNPTRDSPPIQLRPEAVEISRHFNARMYLLWGSGRSNSIVVPLAYVTWHFEGHAVKQDSLANKWTLIEGKGGVDIPEQPYRVTHSYPTWRAFVPYAGVLECN